MKYLSGLSLGWIALITVYLVVAFASFAGYSPGHVLGPTGDTLPVHEAFLGGIVSLVGGIIGVGKKILGGASGAVNATQDSARFTESNNLYQLALAGDKNAFAQLSALRFSYPTEASRAHAAQLVGQLEAQKAAKTKQLLVLAGVAATGVGVYALSRKG